MKMDLVGEMIDHPLDDEFWRVRSPYWRLDKIKCPVLSIGHWGKMGLHLRGNILGYEAVKAPKKLVVTGARNTFDAHKMFDQVEFHEKECLPFYDLHLKGKNNGFMEAEPVKLYVRGANVWKARGGMAAEGDHRAVLSAQGAVGQRHLDERRRHVDREAAAGEPATSYSYPDWEWVNGVAIIGPDGRVDPVKRVLTFTTAPLENDVEVTGPIVLKLYASSTAIDTQFIVKLTDQQPQDEAARKSGAQPGYTPVAKGWLKASHREKDAARSTRDAAVLHPHQPAAAQARRNLSVRHRGAADLVSCSRRATASGWSWPTAIHPRPTGCSRILIIRA